MASDSLKLEARFPASTFDTLRAMGHEVESLGDWDESVGHAGALIRQPNGLLMGVYIFRSYGSRLSPEQKAHIAERAGEWFRKRLDETNNQLKQ